jgi:outer membrane protein
MLAAAMLGLGAAAAALPAAAQQAGENVVQLGWVHFMPNSHGDPLQTQLRPSPLYSALGVPTSFTSDGTGAKVPSFDTAGITWIHFVTDHFAGKLDLGVPARLHLDGMGTVRVPGTIPPPFVVQPIDLGSYKPLASAREWNPTVLLLYYIGPRSWLLHPNIGIGTTYTWFSGVGLNQGFQHQVNSQLGPVLAAANGKPGPTHMNAQVSRSWSPVFNLGLTYDFSRHWGVSESLSYVLEHGNARINVYGSDNTLLATSGTRVTVDPLVNVLFLNYRF